MSLFLVVGCTSYQKQGNPLQRLGFKAYGGYHEEPRNNGWYYLVYQGVKIQDTEILKEYWHRRAAELCPGGYEHRNLALRERDVSSYGGMPGTTVKSKHPYYDGNVKCK